MLYVYKGLPGEEVPHFRGDYTHIVIDEGVISIPPETFMHCHNVETVTMFDNVVAIGKCTFAQCINLKYIKLSKALRVIGRSAFSGCLKIESYCIPPTVTAIGADAFSDNEKLRFVICPRNLPLVKMPSLKGSKLWKKAITRFGIQVVMIRSFRVGARHYNINIRMPEETRTELRGEVRQLLQGNMNGNRLEDISTGQENVSLGQMGSDFRLINTWMHYHLADYPFHVLCFDASVTTRDLNTYDVMHASLINPIHKTSPLHMLSMNPHAPACAFELLFNKWKWSIFKKDNMKKTPLDYAKMYNVEGHLAMIKCLCEYRQSTVVTTAPKENLWSGRLRKRRCLS